MEKFITAKRSIEQLKKKLNDEKEKMLEEFLNSIIDLKYAASIVLFRNIISKKRETMTATDVLRIFNGIFNVQLSPEQLIKMGNFMVTSGETIKKERKREEGRLSASRPRSAAPSSSDPRKGGAGSDSDPRDEQYRNTAYLMVLIHFGYSNEDILNLEDDELQEKVYVILDHFMDIKPLKFIEYSSNIKEYINNCIEKFKELFFSSAKKALRHPIPKQQQEKKTIFTKYRGPRGYQQRLPHMILNNAIITYKKLMDGGNLPFGMNLPFPVQFETKMTGGGESESLFTIVIKNLFNQLEERLKEVHLKVNKKDKDKLTEFFNKMEGEEKKIYDNFKQIAEFTKEINKVGARGVDQDIDISMIEKINKSIVKYNEYEIKLQKPLKKMIERLTKKNEIENKLNNDIYKYIS